MDHALKKQLFLSHNQMNPPEIKAMKEDKDHFFLLLFIAIVFFGIWWCLSPISYYWGADMTAVIRVVEQFSKDGVFPVRGILSSVAAYNMPGLVWLLLPASLIFSDPSFIAIATAIPLNLLAAFILFKLASRLMHRNLAFACMITYCLSPLTFESSRSLWAQHYLGAFYIFIAYFLTKWAIDRKAWYGATAIVFIVYATMVHFSALVLFSAWAFVWLLWNPPIRFSRMLFALLISTILLTPYLFFEMGRDFQDLKAFVTGKSLLYEHMMPLEQSGENNADKLSVDVGYLGRSIARVPKGLFQLLKANFLPIFWKASPTAISFSLYQCLLGFVFIGGLGAVFFLTIRTIYRNFRMFCNKNEISRFKGFVSFFDKREQSYWMLLVVTIIPLSVIAFMGYGQRKSFARPFFPFQCIVGFLILQSIYSIPIYKTKLKRIASTSIIVILAVIQGSAFCFYIFYPTISGHSPAVDANRFLQRRIADFIVNDMKSNNIKELKICYDIIKERQDWQFISKYHFIDPIYYVGMEFDYFLEKYPEIFIPPPVPGGLRSDARYVIVFQEGAKRYDQSKYIKYDFEHFTVLIKKPM
jgi:hypothetical protein